MKVQGRRPLANRSAGVIFLTAISAFCAGCTFLQNRYGDDCKTRAYVRSDVQEFIKVRYSDQSPVRVAIIPFSVPANLASRSNELPGLGNRLAWRIQGEFLKAEFFPIVEVMNREDWPGKKAEFFTGNFGAIQMARDAGYDIAMVGYVDEISGLSVLPVVTKLIEVESGLTLWYGRSEASSDRGSYRGVSSFLGLSTYKPATGDSEALIEEAARCVVSQVRLESER